jgi:P4 family phage/plasmid primase-like protien
MISSTYNSRNKIDEIKNRLDIVDVIGRDISLHHSGNGEYVGSVPPVGSTGRSLKVNQRLQLWNDTKNRKGGDVLDWIGRNFNDPRGSDFPKVLRIAAEQAGVELAEITETELEAVKEKVEIHNFLSETVDVYHQNITERPGLYDYIMDKWSITPDTVNLLKIGYATTSRDLNGLDETTLQKSGLVYVNDGKMGSEVFNGRIIFPYWNNGKVVYLIGRETSETATIESGRGMKYKKLLVHKEGQEYVSPCVQNSYFYGEDSLRGADYCVITEGVADCIVMLQANFPCISPVTVQFQKKDHPKLLSLTKGLKRVYICNDNESNGAGLKGALSTAEALENEQIEARLIILPKPDSIDKIDIADYMRDHSPEDFKGLMDSSVRLWQYKLNKQVISQKATSLERLSAFRSFISIDLAGMSFDEWGVFVSNEVAVKFGLRKKDINETVSKVSKERISSKSKNNCDGSVDGNNNITFDLDSVSGRNDIYRTFADEYIAKNNVICINGKLRKYKDGIYPESDEDIDFIKTEIMKIGSNHSVNLADNNITATLKMIENSTRVRLEDCEPDKDNVIVVNNGILNLKTWELEDFSEDKVYFSKLPVDYLPNAPKPEKFLKFIDMAFKDNKEQGSLAQELAGYTLLKNYKYQAYFYLLGSGGEGKGTYLEILRYMLGEHNVSAASLYQLSDHHELDYHVIELHGKSANICGDAGCKKMVNTETLKKLTSNTDPVRRRRVRERPIDFINYAKIIIALNRLPETNAFTLGDRRRCVIINFNNKVRLDTKEEIKALGEMIRNSGEMPGVLNWAIESSKRLESQQGFTDSRSIAQKTLEYEKKSRPIRYFVEECLEDAPGNIIPNAFLYERFNRFTQKNKSAELSQDEIKREIIKECAEAGWAVGNKLYRVTSLSEELQNSLKTLDIKKASIRCFNGIKLIDEPIPAQSKITECDLLGKKGLLLDVISFKANHGDYKYPIKEPDKFVTDMNSWYPDYTTDEISAAVDLLQANGWKLPIATTT